MECIKILLRNQFFVNLVKVSNNAAERRIKLNSDYTALLIDDLVQWTSLLQAVKDHRHKFPDFFKVALAKSLSNFQTDYLQLLLTLSKCFVYILFFLVLLNVSLHFSYVFNLTILYWWLLVKAHPFLSSSMVYYDVMSEHKKKILSLGNPLIHMT